MSKLLSYQKSFAEFIKTGDMTQLSTFLVSQGKLDVETGLDIYLNNYIVNLTQALRDTFPACEKVVGEEVFCHLAKRYIKKEPPEKPLLSNYGGNFPVFLGAVSFAEPLPFLAELALSLIHI